MEEILQDLNTELARMGYVDGAVMADDQHVRQLSDQYSMHSERQVHQDLFGTQPQDQNLYPTPPIGQQSDLGDNVELF